MKNVCTCTFIQGAFYICILQLHEQTKQKLQVSLHVALKTKYMYLALHKLCMNFQYAETQACDGGHFFVHNKKLSRLMVSTGQRFTRLQFKKNTLCINLREMRRSCGKHTAEII